MPIMSEGLSDEELMLRIAVSGDAWAFEQLWRRNLQPLRRFLQRLCGQESLADDLAQEVWVRILGAAARYQATAKFQTFMFQVAHNLFIDHCRKMAGRGGDSSLSDAEIGGVAAQLASEEPGSEELISREQERQLLRAAILALPPFQRDVITLYLEGKDLQEIALIVMRPFEAVKSQFRFGRDKLARTLPNARRATQ
jgi:RNA polymerase sigma-70 factor (ECF subfamily)